MVKGVRECDPWRTSASIDCLMDMRSSYGRGRIVAGNEDGDVLDVGKGDDPCCKTCISYIADNFLWCIDPKEKCTVCSRLSRRSGLVVIDPIKQVQA